MQEELEEPADGGNVENLIRFDRKGRSRMGSRRLLTEWSPSRTNCPAVEGTWRLLRP